MIEWIRKFSKEKPWATAIIAVVVSSHLFLLFACLFTKRTPPQYVAKTLKVNTKYLPPPKKQPIVQTSNQPVVQRKKIVAKKPVTKTTPKRQNLLRNLEESIAKIDGKRDNFRAKTDLALPMSIDLSRETVEEETFELSYQDKLVEALKSSLKLPGCGNVTLKLTLAKNGSVLGVQVVHGESEVNEEYLSSSLTVMNFPPFEGSLGQYNEQTFLLTFCSD